MMMHDVYVVSQPIQTHDLQRENLVREDPRIILQT
jgi:hypothetical protein